MSRKSRCVFGCDELGVYMHRFPHPRKRSQEFTSWTLIVGTQVQELDPMRVYSTKRVCDYHFQTQDKTSGHRLIKSAVPTLNLQGVIKSLSSVVEAEHNYCLPRIYFPLSEGSSHQQDEIMQPSTSSQSSSTTKTTENITDNSGNGNSAPIPTDALADPISPDTENLATGSPPADESPSADPAENATPAAPETDFEFLTALGDPADEKPTYGENISQNLADRWLPILRRGLSTQNKDSLLKELTIPENCKLLRAPTLNPEISAAITESARARDKEFEKAQQQLGLGISAINRALTLLVTGCEDKESKVKVIKMLSDSCKVLTDLHFVETQARIKAITPALDKVFVQIVEDVERDESLFGMKLSDKIKVSKAIEKQGLQIKKAVPPQKPAPSTSQSTTRRHYPGNWTAPFRHQSSNRGGKGGAPKTPSSTYKPAPAPPAPPTRNSSQSKRGARRN